MLYMIERFLPNSLLKHASKQTTRRRLTGNCGIKKFNRKKSLEEGIIILDVSHSFFSDIYCLFLLHILENTTTNTSIRPG